MAVIFDLDQTLIDTKSLKPFRDNRQWKLIRQNSNNIFLYPYISQMLTTLAENKIPVAIVTNSPRFYVDILLNHFTLPITYIVAYHDTKKHKPNPEPMLKALSILNSNPSDTLAIGDSVNDILAAKHANIISCAALWDSDDPILLRSANPDYEFKNPQDFLSFAINFHK